MPFPDFFAKFNESNQIKAISVTQSRHAINCNRTPTVFFQAYDSVKPV